MSGLRFIVGGARTGGRARRRRRIRQTRATRNYRPSCRHHHHCGCHRPKGNVKLGLLDSIAREELALARLINAEAKKTQKLACNIGGPFTPDEVIAFQHSVANVLDRVVHKEKLLLKKLRLVMALQDSAQCNGEPGGGCPPDSGEPHE